MSSSGVRWGFVLKSVAACVVVFIGLYVTALFVFQRSLLFPRPSLASAPPRPADARQVWVPTSAGRVEAWYFRPFRAPETPAPVILFFHGNGEVIDFLPGEFVEARRSGFGVLLVEFPGYGRSAGSPSEAAISEAALAAHDWALSERTIDPARIVAHGRSLGGAAAAILAVKRSTAALVLESTFVSIRSFAHLFYVPEFLVRDPFDTLSSLPSYRGPVLVLHGTRDEVVPPQHAQMLAAAAPRSELRFLACGHNDCLRPWALVASFLAVHGIVPD